ncbi:MAG: ATP-binding protein [Pseudomonadota bacterium]
MARAIAWLARRRPWPATLRGQLIALLLLALVAAQIVAVVALFDERRQAVRAALIGEALSRMASVALLVERTPPALHPRVLAAASTPLARFSLDTESAVGAGQLSRRALRWRARLLSALAETSEDDWTTRVQLALARSEDGAHRGWRPRRQLVAAVEIAPGRWLNLRARLRRAPLQWAWASVLSLGLSAGAIVAAVTLVIGRTTRPLRDLATAADRFGRGARGETVTPSGPVEARRLIAAFNAMQERLSRFVADRTRLLASISHDLRTPITAMRLRAEMVEDADTRARLIEGLDEMQRLTEASLSFAREEATEEAMRALDLGALLDSLADDFAELGAPISIEASTRAVIEGRPVALRRALRNLIENALRYGGVARLSLVTAGTTATVLVEDDGPGLPEAEIEAMFAPFARLETSRSRETGGAGLGLPIARTVVRGHGGDLHLENRPEGGLRARLTLPLYTVT